MPISHKHLLEKYIDHVTQREGIDLVTYGKTPTGAMLAHSNVEFTSEEVEFFKRTRRMLDIESDGV